MNTDALEMIRISLSVGLVAAGAVFFAAGTVGMLRFPDVFTRLHAMTKADNLGFGFVALGVALVAPQFGVAVKIIIIWAFVLLASTTAAHIVGRAAVREEPDAYTPPVEPDEEPT